MYILEIRLFTNILLIKKPEKPFTSVNHFQTAQLMSLNIFR